MGEFRRPSPEEFGKASPSEISEGQNRKEEVNIRIGDRYRELGRLDDALEAYTKAQSRERLLQIKQDFIARGQLDRALKAAKAAHESLTYQDCLILAKECFTRGDFNTGYEALRIAGYKVTSTGNDLKNYAVISNVEIKKVGDSFSSREVAPPIPAEILMTMGEAHAKRQGWYEARRCYEEALDSAKVTKNHQVEKWAIMALKKLGDDCQKNNALFDAMWAYKAARDTNKLQGLSQIAAKTKGYDWLMGWTEEVIFDLEQSELTTGELVAK